MNVRARVRARVTVTVRVGVTARVRVRVRVRASIPRSSRALADPSRRHCAWPYPTQTQL